MEWKFNKGRLNNILKADDELNKIISKNNMNRSVCPYDNLVLYTDRLVTTAFWSLVKPAGYKNGMQTQDTRYRYFLSHELFIVQWGKVYSRLPNTVIKINQIRTPYHHHSY